MPPNQIGGQSLKLYQSLQLNSTENFSGFVALSGLEVQNLALVRVRDDECTRR